MPILQQEIEARPTTVAPSAAIELMWVLHCCTADHALQGQFASLERIREAHGPALRSFWGDGDLRGFTEVVVLAYRSGTLSDLDLGAFFAKLDGACAGEAGTPSLLSETERERAAIVKRLEVLRDDSATRVRYVALLKAVWEGVRPEWESIGRPAALAAAEDWRRRTRDGLSFKALLERPRLWLGRPELDGLAGAASDEGRLVLTPCWFGGDIHIVELDGTMYLGRGTQPRDDDATIKHAAGEISSQMKAIADPTRVAILLWIGHRPASVTEIARHFKLSQPTVSAHVQVLREAGILDEKQDGRSAKLSVGEESLRRMFSGAQESMLKHLRR